MDVAIDTGRPAGRPIFRPLDRAEAKSILERNNLGRIAFGFHDRVDIQPIHYAFDDVWIYIRTSPGMKTEVIQHNYWIAFEVEEVDGLFDWKSVVVHGGAYRLDPDTEDHCEAYDRAVALLDRLVPGTLTEDDPVPERSIVYRIAVQEVTGRQASSR